MTVYKSAIFKDDCSGAGLTEALLAMAVVAIAAPFVYNQVVATTRTASDIRMAQRIIATRG